MLATLSQRLAASGPLVSSPPVPAPDDGTDLATVIQRVLRQEFQLFAQQQQWQFKINLVLAFLAIFLGIFGILPTLALIVGAGSAAH